MFLDQRTVNRGHTAYKDYDINHSDEHKKRFELCLQFYIVDYNSKGLTQWQPNPWTLWRLTGPKPRPLGCKRVLESTRTRHAIIIHR